MKAPLSYAPAAPAAIGLTAGIVLAIAGFWWIAAVAGSCAFIFMYYWRRHYMAFIALFIAIGAIIAHIHKPEQLPAALLNKEIVYSAGVVESAEYGHSQRLIVDIHQTDGESVPEVRCALTVFSLEPTFVRGQQIIFRAKVFPMEFIQDVPHQTDNRQFFLTKGITAQASAGPDEVTIVTNPQGLDRLVNDVRAAIHDAIVTSGTSQETSALLLAVILGDREYLAPDTADRFRTAGIAHVLALSGLHVGIIAMITGWILLPLNMLRRGRKTRLLLSIIVIWAYAIVSGASPSVIRASVMLTVMIVTLIAERHYNGFNSLSVAVIAILVCSPYSVLSPGFQLSVAAVAGILMFIPLVPQRMRRHRCIYLIVNTSALSMAAMAATGMISAWYFHRFPVTFLPGNILAGIFMPALLIAGICLIPLSLAGIHLPILASAVDFLYNLFALGFTLPQRIPGAEISGLYFSAWALIPYFAALVLFAIGLSLHRRIYCIWAATMALSTAGIVLVTRERLPQSELYIPRSRQYTAVIIRHDEHAWLITGGSDANKADAATDIGMRYRNFLMSRGCNDGFKPLPSAAGTEWVTRNDPYFSFANYNFCLLTDNTLPRRRSARLHYLIVSKGYTGNITETCRALMPDTLLLSTDLNPMRRERYIRQCGDTIPYRDLSASPFSIVYE